MRIGLPLQFNNPVLQFGLEIALENASTERYSPMKINSAQTSVIIHHGSAQREYRNHVDAAVCRIATSLLRLTSPLNH
jgi:hypothetical protein